MKNRVDINSPYARIAACDLRLLHAMKCIHDMIAVSSLGCMLTLGSKSTIHRSGIVDMLLQLGVDPVRIDEDFLSETSTMMAETSVESANATISSAAIVFAHSIADDILFDLCKLVSDIEPAPWIDICQQRKVSLADVCNNTSDEIIRSILEEYFVQLKRESLMKKADLFLRALKPGLDEEDITRRFNRQELARIDAVRHECVHDSRFTVEKAAAIDDVKTLEEVVDVFITLLCKRYGIERNRDKAADRLTKGSCLS